VTVNSNFSEDDQLELFNGELFNRVLFPKLIFSIGDFLLWDPILLCWV